MVVRSVGLLLGVRLRETWNTARRETGLGQWAFAALAVVLACTAFVLPLAMCTLLGAKLVGALGGSGAAGAELFLAGFHAVIVLVLGGVGGVRTTPNFHPSLVAALPVAPAAHGLAELLPGLLSPAALAGGACAVGLAAGAASNGPVVAVAAALLLVQALVGLALVHGAVRVAIVAVRTRPAARGVALAVLGAIALAWLLANPDVRDASRALLHALPSTHGVVALGEIGRGDVARGLARALAAAVPVLLLVPVVASALARTTRTLRAGAASPSVDLLSFKGPVRAVASVFVAQVWRTRRGRTLCLVPALLTAMAVVLVWLVRNDPDAQIPAPVLAAVAASAWFAAVPAMIVLFVDQDLWINQFGWDRGGLAGMLLLPVDPVSIVRGKMLGFAALVALQSAVALPPLLLLKVPGPDELALCVAQSAVAVLAAGAIGLDFSMRRPRTVAPDTTGNTMPWSLILVGPVLAAVVFLGIGIASLVGRALLPGVPGAAALGVAALGLVAWRLWEAEVPRFAAQLVAGQERIVGAVRG